MTVKKNHFFTLFIRRFPDAIIAYIMRARFDVFKTPVAQRAFLVAGFH
jgi:hypothetical protein